MDSQDKDAQQGEMYNWPTIMATQDPIQMEPVEVEANHRVRNSQGKQPLHLAVERGDVEVVKMLLSKGADIDACDKQKASPLSLIVKRKDTKMLETVLESFPGVDLGSKRLPTGQTVLQDCFGNPEATKLLLKRGASAMTRNNTDVIHAVFRAALAQNGAETVRHYLDAGFQPDWTNNDGRSVLHTASFSGQLATVQLLAERGANVNATDRKGTAPIHHAARRDTPEIVEYLLDKGANLEGISEAYGTPLMAAAWEGKTETVKFLLGQKANVNATSTKSTYYTAPQAAAYRDLPTIVEILPQQGADVNLAGGRYGSALCDAIHAGSIDVTKLLLEAKANVNYAGGMPVRVAIQKGHGDILQMLLEHGAGRSERHQHLGKRKRPDMDYTYLRNHWGQTDLIHAIRRESDYDVDAMLEMGSDALSRDVRGRDALYWAALRGYPAMFDVVFRQVEKMTQTQSSIILAINAAAAAGNARFVKELLAKTDFASPWELADSNGWTALYTAEQYDEPEIVDMIRDAMGGVAGASKGAPPPLKTPTEWHPLDMAFSLVRQPDATSISLRQSLCDLWDIGIVRANHPMVPTSDGVYYFEVTVVNQGYSSSALAWVSVAKTPRWPPGTWWYFGDNGQFYEGGIDRYNNYGPKYGEGDVIGRGVNFDKKTAFYTKNGQIIGRAFPYVQGRLYPAVMVGARMTGFVWKAQFWGQGGDETAGFRFKGPYTDEKTFLDYRHDLDIQGE